ncbi:MAG: Mur ligase family protein [Planctomycetota bacterium]
MPSLDPDRRTDRAIPLADVGRLIGRPDLFAGDTRTITHATDDSRRVGPGGLFVATDGNRLDGADFAADAVARGAAAVISYRAIEADARTAVVDDPRPVGSLVEAAIAGRPDDRVRVAAVTGTDGKTTTTWLTRHLLGTVGRRCGLVGTIETDDGTTTRPADLTTPKAETFWPLLGRMDATGVRHAAVECSSQALDQRRLAGLRIDAAVVTNLTADHLDYHGSVDAYAAAKARLFEGLRPGGWAVLNADDPHCDRFAAAVPAGRAVLRFGFGEDADLAARDIRIDGDGTSFTLAFGRDRRAVRLSLPGRHNVANALAASA